MLNDSFLLQTKLYQPPVTEDFVPRTGLFRYLDRVQLRPLTLLSAPAGYGKTTLLSAWLQNVDLPNAWFSLDENDNELVIFLTYFVAAIQKLFPNIGKQTLSIARSPTLPPVPVVVNHLASELDHVERDFILVLEDYHMITEPAIHALITELLHHPHQHMHLVLSTRYDPPLPLTNFRARNQLVEIRAQDLRFTSGEVADFVRQVLGYPPDEETVSILEKKTEGWPAGLRLASLALRHWGDADHKPVILQVETRYVMEYLLSEVLSRQPLAIQEFLIHTSLLDRLCAPLCEAVIGPDHLGLSGQAALQWLDDKSLFIESLDSEGRWCRYHQLFRQLLQRRLVDQHSPDEIAAFHNRASVWYAQNGLVEEAIDHALEGGDVKAAVKLVVKHGFALMNQEQWTRLESWLNKFPQPVADQDPKLLIMKAWTYQTRWHLHKALEILAKLDLPAIKPLFESEEDLHLQGALDVLKAVRFNYAADFPEAIACARRALENTPREWYLVRSFAWLHLAWGLQQSGDLRQALAVLAEGQAEDFSNPSQPRTRVGVSACFIYWAAADLPNLIQTTNHVLKIGQRSDFLESIGWAHVFAGGVCYHQNNLREAEQHFSILAQHHYAWHPNSFVQSGIGLAAIYQAQGQVEMANQAVEQAIEYALEIGNVPLVSTARAFQAELALLQGNLAGASQWAAEAEIRRPILSPYFYQEQITLPKVLLALNTPASLKQAAEELSRLHDIATFTHSTRNLIEILALQALLYDASRDQQAAYKALTQALVLAQPSGYIRLFVDLGIRLTNLLEQLHKVGVLPKYIEQILASFATQKPALVGHSNELLEPLTEREQDVLQLLAQRMSNKEIAEALVISPVTVKRHTIKIYQKLNVNTRRDAVAMAAQLGLISQKPILPATNGAY